MREDALLLKILATPKAMLFSIIAIIIAIIVATLYSVHRQHHFPTAELFPSKKTATAWCPNCGKYTQVSPENLHREYNNCKCRGFYGWSVIFPPPHRWSKWVPREKIIERRYTVRADYSVVEKCPVRSGHRIGSLLCEDECPMFRGRKNDNTIFCVGEAPNE